MQNRSQLVRAKYVKGEATLEKIREACMEEIISFGYHRTSVCEIVRRANLTRGAFYNYWTSLDDCLADLILAIREIVKNDEDAIEYHSKLNDPSATVKKIRVVHYLLQQKKSPYMLLPMALLQEKTIANQELKDLLRTYLLTVKSEYLSVLNEDQAAGLLRDDIDTEVVSAAILNFFKGIFEKNVLEFDEFTEPLEAAFAHFLGSCLAPDYLAEHPIADIFRAPQAEAAAPATSAAAPVAVVVD
ncbi:MAG: TetR/AcrR family transcriptional regulator [bacterium]|nr:TetR/AcrR family transcriptional regulator [bacterium]